MVLVFQIILGVGIAGFLVVVFKKIPVLLNYPRRPFEETSLKHKIVSRIKKIKESANQSEVLHNAIIPKTEKFLRKFRVFVLKLHNSSARITSYLKKKKQDPPM
ncbi:MAG: hypothetical protein V1686_02445 [Patescibacteria group bacterium]